MSEQLAPASEDTTTGWSSVTRKYRTPDGTVYVTIAYTDDGPWIDCTVGKGGTAIQASAHAMSALAGTALRHGTPKESIALCLRGVTHERSVRFGNDALSVPDALGFAIQEML